MVTEKRLATCPTCNCRGEFEFLGEQHWPPELVRAYSLPEVIGLWSCPSCLTTISEPDLLPERLGVNCAPEARAYSSLDNP